MKYSKQPSVDSLTPLPDTLTWSATIDEGQGEQEITELMIRRACEQMDSEQQYPFCSTRQSPRILQHGDANGGCHQHTRKRDNVISMFDYLGAA